MDATYLINTLWVLVAGVLVFFMQAGFALLEAGLTRPKNTINILAKNTLDFGFAIAAYALLGFGIMYGTSGPGGLFGTSLFLSPLKGFEIEGLSPEVFYFFQLVFAGATATIVSGAMAERTKFMSYIVYSFFISLIIYPVSGHWIWGGGWLSDIGFMDFAGSTAVHSAGGWVALAGAMIVGPRLGKYSKEGKARAIPAGNIFMATLGMFILWLGWYGFNPGSELGFDEVTIHTVVTTTMAAGGGMLASLVVTWKRYGKPDLSMVLNGILGGLVAVTSGCPYFSFWVSFLIGVLGGILVIFSVEFIDRKLKIDDPVGAISVHGVCGALGTLCIGLFASVNTDAKGLFYGGGFSQLGIQALGVVVVFAWTFGAGFLLFKIIKKTIGLRVEKEEEIIGLDIVEHGAEAYPDFVSQERDA
ncbi:MAG: ammonium transporter [Clostridiales Family XIII bacterium]|jgi:Amt family ammonium transporter|nr:ammonium transporter [Clostridiales Family XIII bacterium]